MMGIHACLPASYTPSETSQPGQLQPGQLQPSQLLLPGKAEDGCNGVHHLTPSTA